MLPSLAILSPCPVRLSPKAGRARRKEEVSRLKGWVLVAQDAFTTDCAKNPSESTSILVNAAQMANDALSFNDGWALSMMEVLFRCTRAGSTLLAAA